MERSRDGRADDDWREERCETGEETDGGGGSGGCGCGSERGGGGCWIGITNDAPTPGQAGFP
jgi:hypothetical protein